MPDTILIIDDEAPIREALSGILADEGFKALTAANAEEGFGILEREEVQLVLLDIWMPGMDGLEALTVIRERFDLPIIMISGHGTIETAVQATRKGAFDFIEKPLSYDKIILAIKNGIHVARLERENRLLKAASPKQTEITGTSPAILRVKKQIERVAPTDASVLILGEHGTGKELVAQTIHHQSTRSGHPLVEVNCAAIPEDLIESELFGHEKGSFTGATERRQGKFDQADGGTLFLDEIGDMSLKSQAKVLRILQEQRFERVGGSKTINVDVRILAATNKNLEEEIAAGNFRADLFYRLNVVPIEVPGLNDRRQDIPLLVEAFLSQFRKKGLGKKEFTSRSLELFMAHSWPGNIRELKNMVERLLIMTSGSIIHSEDVGQYLGDPAENPASIPFPEVVADYRDLNFKDARKQFEHDYLKARLLENEGNISRTAQQVGMERSHLHKKVKALAIELNPATSA
ncbi:MAG: sigma-54 dependent transcriptional regulator [Desulfobulbaceae bacterium]|nr:sigma-54 dependent transcriptional regulator [Desulfobulbaceae bacterium]